MPSASHSDDDDPVIASYDVFITPTQSSEQDSTTSNLYVLQYPSHRPSFKPYSAAKSQKPTTLRSKPRTGVLEIDVPLFTDQNYNDRKGLQFGRALAETRVAHSASGHGLSGGFSSGQNTATHLNVQDIPHHDEEEEEEPLLTTQTLGGKTVKASDHDPVYMLAAMRGTSIHLTRVDGMIQMRPQLQHLDARDELANRKAQGTKVKQNFEGPPVKLETKAIEMKIKDSKEDAKDRNLNANAKLLREIQADQWKSHDWIDQDDEAASEAYEAYTLAPPPTDGITSKSSLSQVPTLKSSIDNDEWLDRMSSPGIELRTRLKGRDRERARRKRQERLRLSKAEAHNSGGSNVLNAVTAGPFVEEGSATESSSEEDDGDDDGDVEMVDSITAGQKDATTIKSEPESTTQKAAAGSVSKSVDTPKKRGRPKKIQVAELVEVDD